MWGAGFLAKGGVSVTKTCADLIQRIREQP